MNTYSRRDIVRAGAVVTGAAALTTIPAPAWGAVTLTLKLDKTSYSPGDKMTATATYSGAKGKKTWTVQDPSNGWVLTNDSGSVASFSATAPSQDVSSAVTVTLSTKSGSASASASYSVALPPPPPVGTTLMGVSLSDEDHGLDHWDAAHCYNISKVDDSQFYPITAKSIVFSDSTRWTGDGSNAPVSSIRSDLLNLRSQYPDLEIRYYWGNELDRKISSATSGIIQSFANLRTMVDGLADPKITLWASFTGNIFRSSSIDGYQGLVPYAHGVGANLYPPGRNQSPVYPTNYSEFVDPVASKLASWGVKLFACPETGIPVFDRPTFPAPYRNRPEYMKGLRDYTLAKFKALNIPVTDMCYWDQMLVNGPDNRLFWDEPQTALAWTTF